MCKYKKYIYDIKYIKTSKQKTYIYIYIQKHGKNANIIHMKKYIETKTKIYIYI